jgi:outer membrane protein
VRLALQRRAMTAAAALVASASLLAQEAPAARNAPETRKPLWELGIGVAGLRVPDYRGSDQSSNYLLPLPYVVYRGQRLRADRGSARAVLLDTERAEVDISVSGSVPTRSRDNAARGGMPDLPPTIEVGPNLKFALLRSADRRVRLELGLPLRAAITVERTPRSIGTTFTPRLNLDIATRSGWNVGLLGGPVFGDRRHHAHFYGVDAAHATPSRPAYRAPGGYAGWQALASASRRFERTWVGAFMRYDSLRGASFDASPLLRRDRALMLGIGVSWVLSSSSELVASPE